MTLKNRNQLKAWRQARKAQIVAASYKKPKGENMVLFHGGMIQDGRFTKR